ncbi:hypothetical protein [Denitrobaculum tricleocarpae]|uniref:GNAT family N-acetyltransferase n=1 Tax=Denitrobaculum tricleocarpae TaxID=2591009 RepID=A0A545TMC7_9PROT|nr:hypothetical protein [Denitrobaculum tricleocarpae]TQV78364.1 hypothetical protein FKG95_17505 [Denitrobaculum tricleocarpae]
MTTFRNDFRKQIELKFGPLKLLDGFFAAAERIADEHGLLLSIETDFEALLAFNKTQTASWYPLTPMYDPRVNHMSPETSFWISGRDQRGDIVATQCARFYDWTGTNFKAEFESLRLAYEYPDAVMFPEELAICEAPSATAITGPVCFSGAAWYRPDYRGTGLSAFLPRISRTLAYTKWNTHYTYSFIEPKLAAKGVAERYGYTHVEPGVEWLNSFRGSCTFCLLWMHRDQLLADMQWWTHQQGTAMESLFA